MMAQVIKCQFCGNGDQKYLESRADTSIFCKACKRSFFMGTAKGLYDKISADWKEADLRAYKRAVQNMDDEAELKHPNSKRMVEYATEVKNLNPGHPIANMYEVIFSGSTLLQRVERYFKSLQSQELTPDVKTFIAKSFIRFFKPLYEAELKKFIKENKLATELLDQIKAEIKKHDAGVYDCTISRDVFVSLKYTERNTAVAMAVIETIENDGNECWISCRNLENNDSDYTSHIRTAIKNCKIFLVISSEETHRSKDVQDELDIAEELNKPRLEYKIDDHTTRRFKEFFNGISWIDASHDPFAKNKLEEVADRVYETLKSLKKPVTPVMPMETPQIILTPKDTHEMTPIEYYLLGVEHAEKQEYKEAFGYYQKAAEQGHAHAQNNLGQCYFFGEGIGQDYEKAVNWFTKAAEQGNPSAQSNLGICYRDGKGVKQDIDKAIYWFEKIATKGFGNVKRDLEKLKKEKEGKQKPNKLNTHSLILVPPNIPEVSIWSKKPIEWVKEAVVQHGPYKCIDIKKGDDVIEHVEEFARTATEDYCVVVYADTPLLRTETIGKALSFLIDNNYKIVQLPRGWIFNLKYIKDIKGSADAVEMPDVDEDEFMAAYNIAQVHRIAAIMRDRMPPDIVKKADEEYEEQRKENMATAAASASNYSKLGTYYLGEDGKTKDLKLSFENYLKAAELGDITSQLVTGDNYENGRGTEQDFEKARKWYYFVFYQGTQQGNKSIKEQAQKKLDELNKRLKKDAEDAEDGEDW